MLHLDLDTSWGRLRLAGGSRAGEGSLVVLPQLRLAIDAGRPARALVPMHTVFVSHGHSDHLLGLPAWAAQRHLQGMKTGHVLAPLDTVEPLRQLLAVFASLEGGEAYDVQVHGVSASGRRTLRRDMELSFFSTSHWVETLGCCLWWTRHRLRPELEGADPEELRLARERGEVITEAVRTPLLAYVADTGPAVFESEPWLAEVEILVAECTFIRPGEIGRARRFGHMHLDDLAERRTWFRNRHLVLGHLSRRHRLAAGERAIRTTLRDGLEPRLHFLNVEWT